MLDCLVALLGRSYCLACRHRLDDRSAVDLTGGNRGAVLYHCRRCGSHLEVRVPAPGGAVVRGVPARGSGGAA